MLADGEAELSCGCDTNVAEARGGASTDLWRQWADIDTVLGLLADSGHDASRYVDRS